MKLGALLLPTLLALPVACALEAPPAAVPSGAHPVTQAPPPRPACPDDMVLAGRACMDRYEAYVVEIDKSGREKPHSPYLPVERARVKAKNGEGEVPQAYISQIESKGACEEAGKRLCTADEFTFACSSGHPEANDYPYGGHEHKDGFCNEGKGSQMYRFFGSDPHAWTSANLNDPRLNQAAGGLARSGEYPKCVSSFGVHDCVGNLHEWGADAPDASGLGRFRGGFYGDAEVNGHGCKYVTRAHGPGYHDYSTGFRCCADPSGLEWAKTEEGRARPAAAR